MKRDPELIRLILKDLQEIPLGEIIEDAKYHDRYDDAIVREHMRLLIEEGFVLGITQSDRGKISHVSLEKLTWKGHDFFDAAQDNSVWQKAKEVVLKPGISFTWDILLEWLKDEAKLKLGLP